MSAIITFEVPGQPRGKGRPRATVRGGHARMYTPAETEAYESLVRMCAAQALSGRPIFEGPVEVMVQIVLARPKRLCRKADPIGRILCASKPDADNVVKAILDGCKVLWRDDAQVAHMDVWKYYAARDEAPHVRVQVGAL